MMFSCVSVTFLLFLAVVSTSNGDNLRSPNNNSEARELLEAKSTLLSGQCTRFTQAKLDKINELVERNHNNGNDDDDTITSLFCQPLEMETLRVEKRKLGARNAKDTCESAFDTVVSSGSDVIDMALGSVEECRKEVKKEVNIIREENQRTDGGSQGSLSYPLLLMLDSLVLVEPTTTTGDEDAPTISPAPTVSPAPTISPAPTTFDISSIRFLEVNYTNYTETNYTEYRDLEDMEDYAEEYY